MREVNRGIVVDSEGYFLAAIQWDAGGPKPRINFPRRGEKKIRPENRKHLLMSDYAIENAAPNARWDFKPVRELQDPDDPSSPMVKVRDGTWRFPETEIFLVDKSGNYKGRRKVWPDRFVVPLGLRVVETPPPVEKGRRPIWDAAAAEWRFPRKVCVANASGLVENIVLENPRDDTPDVEIPDGGSRVDDRDGELLDDNGRPPEPGRTLLTSSGLKCMRRLNSMTKAQFMVAIRGRSRANAFTAHLEARGLQDKWTAIGDQDPVDFFDPMIFAFLESEGLSGDEIYQFSEAIT